MRALAHIYRSVFAAGLLALLGLLAGPVQAQLEPQPVPPLLGRVMDRTATLSAAQTEALERKLADFEREAGSQLVILIVASSQPEDIAAYAQRVGDSWKIGRRGVGDGLLLVVAKNDRKVRIEVAKALEGAVPDLAARQIIQNAISPAFKAGDYAGGLNLAVDQLQARIRGEALAPPTEAPGAAGSMAREFEGLDVPALGALMFFGVPVLGGLLTGIFGRKFGSLLTGGATAGLAWWWAASLLLAGLAGLGALLLVGLFGVGSATRRSGLGGGRSRRGGLDGPVIWGGGGWGGSDSSGGGGGFSSGGGGDFGGGGASGDW